MRKEEQKLWDAMRRAAPERVWLQRIENVFSDGMPDVWAGLVNHPMKSGFHAWFELKAPKRPKRPGTPLLGAKKGLRQSQVNWHVKAATGSLPVFTVIRDDHRELFMVHCSFARTLNDMTVDEVRAVSVADTWEGIFGRVFG